MVEEASRGHSGPFSGEQVRIEHKRRDGLDFWQLSSKSIKPIGVSAISGTGTGELLDAVCESLPEPPTMQEQITIADANKDKETSRYLLVFLVGRRASKGRVLY